MSLRGAEGGAAISEKTTNSDRNALGSNIVRRIILPQLEKEINRGRNFAPLRQMFYSMILASWYKMTLKDALLSRIYGNQSKVKVGVNQPDPGMNEEIFDRYLRAYKKGVFNYIKEDIDKVSRQPIPRKYFSGGTNFSMLAENGKIMHRFKDLDMMPSGDSLVSGNVWDAAILVGPTRQVGKSQDEAGEAINHKNYLKTVVWLSKKMNGQGIPEVRYTRVSTLTVGPDEEKAFLKGILKGKDIVLLTKETLKMAKKGNAKITLTNESGIIPDKYLGEKVILSGNVAEILDGFDANDDNLPEKLEKAPKIAIRVNEVFRVKVHDRSIDRYLYFLPFNRTALDQGNLRLSALGGGVRFKKGGLNYYRKYVDPQIRTIPGEDERDVRVIIQGKNLDKMLKMLKEADHIEDNVDHELEDELNGENGLFPAGVPKKWLSTDSAMDSQKEKTREELKTYGFSFPAKGPVEYNEEDNQTTWRPGTKWSPQEGKWRVKTWDSLRQITLYSFDSMIFYRKSRNPVYVTMADVFEDNGQVHRHPVLIKEFMYEGLPAYYAMAFIPGVSNLVDFQEKNGITFSDLINKRIQIIKYLSDRSLQPPYEFIYTSDGNVVPIDAKAVYSDDFRLIIPRIEAVQADILDQVAGPESAYKFYGRVKFEHPNQDEAMIGGVFKSFRKQIQFSRRQSSEVLGNPAMKAQALVKNGGINLNSGNMQMGIQKDGQGIELRLDPAMIERIKTEGFDGLEFNIQSIIPVTNLSLLLGLGSDTAHLQVLN